MDTLRRVFRWIHLVAAGLVVVGVFVQVYLAAATLRGATDIDAHAEAGWLVHNLELLVLVAAVVAWLPRAEIVLAFTLALVGTAQILIVEADRWVGAIHGAAALVVLILASIIVHRGMRGLGLSRARVDDPAGTDTPRSEP